MELKKYYKANLENKRFLFREIGLISSLLILFLVFEYSVKPKDVDVLAISQKAGEEMEFVPITEIEKPKPQVAIAKPLPKLPSKVVETTNILEADTSSLIGLETGFNFEGLDSMSAVPAVLEPQLVAHPQKKPQYPGGMKALYRDVSNNLEYPAIAIELGQKGKVVVRFVVNTQGQATDAEILGVSPGIALEAEAKRIIKKLKKFKPAEQLGAKVPTYFVLPIEFQLP